MPKEGEKLGVSSLTLVSESGVGYGQARQLTQYTAAIAVTMGALAAGTVLSWTSPTKTQIVDNGDLGFTVTDDEFSWVGGLMCLGAAVICFPIALVMDVIGRKITMLLLIIPFTIGWCLIYWAESVLMLYFGRFLTGLAGGAFCVSAPLYTSEIAQKEIRGTLGSYFQLMVTVGILFDYVAGAFLSVSDLTLCCLIIPFIFVLVFFFQPETPVYYVKKGKIEDARKSLTFFRGPHYNVELELQDMIAANEDSSSGYTSRTQILKTKGAQKAVLISFGLMLFQQFSGVNAVIFYAGNIFKEAGVGIKPDYAVIIVGVMQVIATFIASIVVEKLGRKILLLASDIVMAICSILLAVYFNLTEENKTSVSWLPILALSLFIILFSLGFGPIPWMMVGEVVPKELKSTLTSTACTFNWVLAFFVTKFYQPLSDATSQSATFYGFATVSIIGTIFVFLLVPETKGKTLDEIQRELNGEPRLTHHPAGGAQTNPGYNKNEN
ncbi:facilitated trehalose transporter Tret1-like isoform X2 [Chrysoperla carnea]|nr:facilitated trehalose transporter Tret1-like isoform X2 [Chrysoperla carnea]